MRLVLLFFFYITLSSAQLKICSWNVENLGKSKSDATITYIAATVKEFDVVAIQEVVAGYGGTQAVAKLVDELNRTGTKWNYVVSKPTTGSSYKRERYAFLWKTNKVQQKGKTWLEKKYQKEIDREPFFATFVYNERTFTLVNFHAITKMMQPETEIKYFKFLPDLYPTLDLIFLGDFNCPESHSVFNPLKKMDYQSVFQNQKTSLKRGCINNNCLSSEFDNIFFNSKKFEKTESGVVLFFMDFESHDFARKVSDHIPIWVSLKMD